MTTFTISSDNNITAYSSAAEAKGQPDAEVFSSAKELGSLAGNWPGSRLVEIWNALPGQKPVKKFTSRKTAVNRIWAAIQHLNPNGDAQAPTVAPKKAKSGKRGRKAKSPATARERSKTAKILDLLKRNGGSTLKELMRATGWQAHSVRGFLSRKVGKDLGLTIESTKGADGGRTYSIQA